MHKQFNRKLFTQAIFFTYSAKYFQTLSGEKWRSFANSLRSMLKLRSALHEAACQFGLQFWTDVWPSHFYNCF